MRHAYAYILICCWLAATVAPNQPQDHDITYLPILLAVFLHPRWRKCFIFEGEPSGLTTFCLSHLQLVTAQPHIDSFTVLGT